MIIDEEALKEAQRLGWRSWQIGSPYVENIIQWYEAARAKPSEPVDDDPSGWHARDDQLESIAQHFSEPEGVEVVTNPHSTFTLPSGFPPGAVFHVLNKGESCTIHYPTMPDNTALIRQLVDALRFYAPQREGLISITNMDSGQCAELALLAGQSYLQQQEGK